jgi:uncharacterized membrane protein YozB (DUF420 family)
MLVEGEILFLFVVVDVVVVERRDAREHEKFVLAAIAELAVVFVKRAAGLAKHGFGGD